MHMVIQPIIKNKVGCIDSHVDKAPTRVVPRRVRACRLLFIRDGRLFSVCWRFVLGSCGMKELRERRNVDEG